MGIPGVSITEATGVPPLPDTGILSRVAILAPALAGAFEAKPIYSLSDLAEFGQGVLVRHGKHVFAETKTPFLAVRCGATNPGSYDTIDNSEFTGTALPAVVASTVPTDEAELYIEFVDGGTLTVDPITYRRSDSNGREGAASMPLRSLGAGTTILFADVNAAIELDPPEAEHVAYIADLRAQTIAHFAMVAFVAGLVALTNDLVTQYEAHRVLIAGGVHGAADVTNVVTAPVATDVPTAIARLNDLRTQYEAHRVLTGGGEHGAADVTNAIVAPVATDEYTAIVLANDIRSRYEAHRVLTAGGVHGAADTTNAVTQSATDYIHGSVDGTSGAGIPAAPTDYATARDTMIALKTAALLHVVNVSGAPAVHGASDTTAQGAINAVVVTASSTNQEVRTAAIAYAAAFFGDGSTTDSGHALRTAGGVHMSEDLVNLVTAPNPGPGTVNAGDIVRVATNAPTPSDSDITSAIDKLVDSSSTPGMLLLPGRTVAALGPTIKIALTTLADAGKPVPAFVQPRKPNAEAPEVHVNAVESEWISAVTDNRICVVAGDYLCAFNDGAKLRTRLTGTATHQAVRAIQTEYFRATWRTVALDKVSILDSVGIPIGWDEAKTPDKPRKVQVFYRVQSGTRPLVPAVDYTLADLDNDRTTTVRERRVTDELHRIVRAWAFAQIGTLAASTAIPNTNTRQLNESVRLSYQQSLAAIIAANMGGTVPEVAISDTDLPDLVAINPIVTAVGAIIYLEVTVNYTVIGAVGRIDTTLSVRTGS